MDPDQLASQKPADLDLHCFQIRIYPGLALLGLIFVLLNKDLSFFKNIVNPDQLASHEAT